MGMQGGRVQFHSWFRPIATCCCSSQSGRPSSSGNPSIRSNSYRLKLFRDARDAFAATGALVVKAAKHSFSSVVFSSLSFLFFSSEIPSEELAFFDLYFLDVGF